MKRRSPRPAKTNGSPTKAALLARVTALAQELAAAKKVAFTFTLPLSH
jgi:hypothetical protein